MWTSLMINSETRELSAYNLLTNDTFDNMDVQDLSPGIHNATVLYSIDSEE